MLSTVKRLWNPVWMPVMDWMEGVRSPVKTVVTSLFENTDPLSEVFLEERLNELLKGRHPHSDSWGTTALKDIVSLRKYFHGNTSQGKFLTLLLNFRKGSNHNNCDWRLLVQETAFINMEEAAYRVSELLHRVVKTADQGESWISLLAQRSLVEIFGFHLKGDWHREVALVTDAMLRDNGLPFLTLCLLRSGQLDAARILGKRLLVEEVLEENLRSTLYWMAEIQWFIERGQVNDFQEVVRYLYHLCFVNPERAGFLEIDSQFFSEFEQVNELAREGLLYRETLIEGVIGMWKSLPAFGTECRKILEVITQLKNKVYDDVDLWERFWRREKESFGRDTLAIVEGNLCFASGYFEDAKLLYEKALRWEPKSRIARFNLLFLHARLGEKEKHEALAQQLINDSSLYPSCLYAIGNSYLILGDTENADTFYEALAMADGWQEKADYYRSSFCLEQGLTEQALVYAKRAHEWNPNDANTAYHLSLCYQRRGEPLEALEALKGLENLSDWLLFFRFQLERDAGQTAKASETLRQVPSVYFDREEEFEEAMQFAREQRDLVLIRHLLSHRNS